MSERTSMANFVEVETRVWETIRRTPLPELVEQLDAKVQDAERRVRAIEMIPMGWVAAIGWNMKAMKQEFFAMQLQRERALPGSAALCRFTGFQVLRLWVEVMAMLEVRSLDSELRVPKMVEILSRWLVNP